MADTHPDPQLDDDLAVIEDVATGHWQVHDHLDEAMIVKLQNLKRKAENDEP